MKITLLIISLLLMAVGLLGTIFPVIPGAVLIFSAALIYAIFTKFAEIGVMTLVIFGVLAAISVVVDYVFGAVGAKKLGGSVFGIMGALAGALVGGIIFNIIGIVIGLFVGAIAGELITGKKLAHSGKVGAATVLGFLAGNMMKFLIGAAMIAVFVFLVAAK